MDEALTIYSIFQNLLFALVLISIRKPGNGALILYFVHAFLTDVLYVLSNHFSTPGLSSTWIIDFCYGFITLLKPVIIFYFLYSILQKPMPRLLYGLWTLPILNAIVDYTVKSVSGNFYTAGFYHTWYLNVPAYTKVLMVVLLTKQVTMFNTEIAEKVATEKHQQLIRLYWGKYFVYLHLVLTLFALFYFTITLSNGRLYHLNFSPFIYSPYYYSVVHHLIVSFFLLIFAYFSLRNPSVFNTSPGEMVEQQLAKIALPKEEKNFSKKEDLSPQQATHYEQILNNLMEAEKIYLNQELSLRILSEKAKIPTRRLSQFIQSRFTKNYKEYINGYRVLHAQNLLTQQNNERFTMYSIAFDSGFNSESSFYKIFKDQTGITPKQYQDKYKKEIQAGFNANH